jgi:hypothetical protein
MLVLRRNMPESPFEEYFNVVKILLEECSRDNNLKKELLKYMKEYGVTQEVISKYVTT